MAREKATLCVCMLVLFYGRRYLTSGLVEIAVLTLNRVVYSSFNSNIMKEAGVSIHDYLIQPDIQLYASIFLVLIGTLLPALSGIVFTRVRKQWTVKARACLFVTMVVGFMCTGILTALDVSTIGNVSHAQCLYASDSGCFCGLAVEPYITSVMVCGQFVVRLIYLVCMGLSCVCTILCLITVTWENKPPKKKKMPVLRNTMQWRGMDQVLQKKPRRVKFNAQ